MDLAVALYDQLVVLAFVAQLVAPVCATPSTLSVGLVQKYVNNALR